MFFWQETFVEIACRVHAASPAGDLRPAVLRLVRSGIGWLRPFQRPCYRARQRPLKRPDKSLRPTPTSRKTAGLLSLRASRVNAAEKVLALKNLTANFGCGLCRAVVSGPRHLAMKEILHLLIRFRRDRFKIKPFASPIFLTGLLPTLKLPPPYQLRAPGPSSLYLTFLSQR